MPRLERRGERLAFPDARADDLELSGHVLVADRVRRDIERVDERQSTAEKRRERPRHLGRRKFAGDRTERRQPEHEMVEPRLLAWLFDPRDKSSRGAGDHEHDDHEIRANEVGDGEDHPREKRQLGAEALVEVGERRYDLQDDDRHQRERQGDQDRRLDERGRDLALQRRDDLRVLDVAAEHRLEAAAALAGQKRCRVDARKQIVLRGERVRQRGSRPHSFVDVVENASKDGRLDPALQKIERLHQRHARFEQCRKLLVEDEELVGVDPAPLRQADRQAADGAPALQRQDVEALLLEVVTQARLAVGHIHALDDFTVRRRQPAAELHSSGVPRTGLGPTASDCRDWHLRSRNYTKNGCVPLDSWTVDRE